MEYFIVSPEEKETELGLWVLRNEGDFVREPSILFKALERYYIVILFKVINYIVYSTYLHLSDAIIED